MKTTTANKVILYSILILGGIISMLPFYWMTISSFRSEADIFTKGANLIPNPMKFNFLNYIDLIRDTPMLRWLFNSILTGVVTTIIALVLSSMAGYAFAKYKFFGKNFLFIICISLAVIPQYVTIIPVYILMNKIHLIDSYWSIILPFSANAFAVFLMRQYFIGIPTDIIDSGRIDGCSEFRIFFTIVMPISKPALGASGIFIFQYVWNQFFWPLIMMQSDYMFTIPVGISAKASLIGDVRYGLLMAAAMLSVLPMALVFILLQKQFISGLTAGALKE